MHLSQVDLLAAGAAVVAVWMCGVTRLRAQLAGLCLQTALIAGACVAQGLRPEGGHYLILAATVLLVKAVAIPLFLAWSARQVGVTRDEGTLLAPTLCLFIGGGLLAGTYLLAPRLAAAGAGTAGVSLALLLIGMLLMLTRRLALSQIIGFLVLENGIFLYGLTQAHGMPLLLEMGVAFEVLVAVLIAGLVINRLSATFEHTDVTQLRGLRH